MLFALLQTIGVCMAQSGSLIPVNVWNIYSSATGNSNAFAEVLWTEEFVETDEAQELYSAIESYTGNPNDEISKLISQLKEQISSFKKMRSDVSEGKGNFAGISMSNEMKREYLNEFDAQIKESEEQLAYYSSLSVPEGSDPKELLDKALSHAINNKVYHGVLSLGKGLWAVSESINEDGPRHMCLGNWGVIDESGRTVIDFKYDLIIESDVDHDVIKYGTGFRGNGTLYGLLRFNGTQALPCEYEQLYLSQGNYIAAVLPEASRAYLYDWNMNRLSTAVICYAEPWTRDDSEGEATFYPSIDKNGKVGVYDDNGKLVVPFIYDRGYFEDGVWIGVTGPFPKKITNLEISYDGIDYSNETRYDIHTWKNLSGKE